MSPCTSYSLHEPSPNGHEVEDVGHSRAVAQEAANADLEHNGNHQDLVPAGRTGWNRFRLLGSEQGHQGLGAKRKSTRSDISREMF